MHEIDHINRIRDDNRIANLREATHSQNHMNKPGKGYHRHSLVPHRFVAEIKLNGKAKHLGMFATEAEARVAYEQARRDLFGDFA